MLRILTLATLFPDSTRPAFGIFVERQTRALAVLPDIQLKLIAPLAMPPFPLSLHPHYAHRAALPLREDWHGLDVLRPRFRHMPGLVGRLGPQALVKALRPVLRQLRHEFPFDLIDAQFFFPDGPAAVQLAREFGVPVSIKARGADIHHWGQVRGAAGAIRAAAMSADGLLAVSAALKNDMLALGLPAEKIRVHYTGVDLARFTLIDRADARLVLGLEGPLVVTAGHLIARKGQALVIEAITQLPEVQLILVGDGPDRPKLERLIAQLGVSDRVRLLGNQPHDALPLILGAADVMALPSSSEGLANVWVEALACGTPLVISDAGGAREVVKSPAAGRIVDRSSTAIAAAIAALLRDPPDRLAIRAAAEPFTWAANAQALRAHLIGLRPPTA
jgi:teichuronic acid biosynthesis glycosyltransferase TuaC